MNTDRSRLSIALVRGPLLSTTRALNNEATPAIGLAYLCGMLRHEGYDVTLVDGIAEGLNSTWPWPERQSFQCHGLMIHEIVDMIPTNCMVIGISIMFSGEWPVHRRLVNEIRKRFPAALIVAGGEHVTALTEVSLRECPAIDLAVCGEGEQILTDIALAVEAGTDPRQVEGVAYLADDGAYRQGMVSRIREIDRIPWPYWPDGYLEKFWQAGKSFGVQSERDMPFMVSRGCPFQCTFCSNRKMWTTRYLLRSVDDVLAEMRHYIEKYKASAFQFYDLTAITKRRWIVELCSRMKAEDMAIKWSLPSGTRSEALDFETLSLLKETGCNYLVFAPESGSSRVLKAIKKNITRKSITKSILTAKQLGLVLRSNLIIGFPSETRRDVFVTLMYGIYLAAKGVDEVSVNIFSPYPGSELFEQLLENRSLRVGDDYYYGLTSLNSDYSHFNPLTFNPYMSSLELAAYRISFMLLNYAIGYLLHPTRIVRTINNLFFRDATETVLEHRLKDALKRRRRKPS